MTMRRTFVLAALACAAPLAGAADAPQTKTASLPARGLFEGDKLSALARQKLTELIIDAIGLQVEVALVVPTGPWRTEGSGSDERELTPARLQAVKRFLNERGLERVYVESRIDARASEPRLDVQIVGRPGGH